MWSHQEMNSIFYVDSDYESLSFNNSKMETEVRTLKQELTRTRDALKVATKRCRDLVGELDSRTTSHENERCLRDQQLSRILRALLVLESRLKQEQKSIRQLLCEKDNVIRNQQLEIAKLRRYTKNYIKSKREQGRSNNNGQSSSVEPSSLSSTNFEEDDDHLTLSSTNRDPRNQDEDINNEGIGNELGNDIQRLKKEIIDKLNDEERAREIASEGRNLKDRQTSIFRVRKTNSFAGSDVSKESCASSGENTDAGSILTTTDESSPSLLSTEGFCEGESTDCSPGSTLNKSSSKSFGPGSTRIIDDPRHRETRIDDVVNDDLEDVCPKRRNGVVRAKPIEIFFNDSVPSMMSRSESKDDGMDCNFASDEENLEDMQEPIYVNACSENNARNLRDNRGKNGREGCNFDNNNGPSKMVDEENGLIEETSGNWYSDPDEDRINDEVFRHSTYRPNGNHNSVLECVNQILLRDMEEEDSVLAAPRRFKHRGRIVRFQPARLSDIESVGSEMERRNSDDCSNTDRGETGNEAEIGNFEATASEDEFGMRIDQPISISSLDLEKIATDRDKAASSNETNVAIPIIVIEPKIDGLDCPPTSSPCLEIANNRRSMINRSASPTRRMEIIEEKKCLQMSSKGLTIAKNLDYEDIESLPEIIQPMTKTPPALPPKPTQFRNTLVLKKIPSPSFLIDETRAKNSQRKIEAERLSRGFNDCIASPIKTMGNGFQARSLVFDDKYSPAKTNDNDGNEMRNKVISSNPRSSFLALGNETLRNLENSTPRVTSIVRHFEEFKIGGDDDRTLSRELNSRAKERNRGQREFDDFDMRQNFEEFNLDDCDLSDDPDRPEADGSERLASSNVSRQTINENGDNNNGNATVNNSNGIYDNFLEATGLSNKSILTPSRLLSNHKSMLKPKDVKYKNRIKSNAITEKNGQFVNGNNSQFTQVRHWTGPFV